MRNNRYYYLFSLLMASTIGFSAMAPCSAAVTCVKDGPVSTTAGIPAYSWTEETAPPKAMIVMVHGFCQEALSINVIANDLAKKNYLVYSIDIRGHGRWHTGPGSKKNLVDYTSSVDDVIALCRAAKAAHPDLPLFCLGESAGSGIVAAAAAKDKDLIDGLVLSSPGTRPRVYNLFWMVPDFLCNIWRINHPFKVERYINRYASNDKRVTHEMLEDPLDRKKMSGREIFGTLWFIGRTPLALKHIKRDLPVLVVQGGRDGIVRPCSVPPLLKQVKSSEKKMVVFPKYGHVLVGTNYIKPDVQSTIDTWLDTHVSTRIGGGGNISAVRSVSP